MYVCVVTCSTHMHACNLLEALGRDIRIKNSERTCAHVLTAGNTLNTSHVSEVANTESIVHHCFLGGGGGGSAGAMCGDWLMY